MKIEIKSEVKETKNFNYTLHTLHITEANILDWRKLHGLFSSPDSDIGKWEEYVNELNLFVIGLEFKNITENSFDIEICDYDNNILKYLKDFLFKHNFIM